MPATEERKSTLTFNRMCWGCCAELDAPKDSLDDILAEMRDKGWVCDASVGGRLHCPDCKSKPYRDPDEVWGNTQAPARETRTYEDYLQSDEWKAKAARVKDRAGNRCQLCNAEGPLDAHHRTYEKLGHETEEDDLIALCRACHEQHHAKHLAELDQAQVLEQVNGLQRSLNSLWETLKAKGNQR